MRVGRARRGLEPGADEPLQQVRRCELRAVVLRGADRAAERDQVLGQDVGQHLLARLVGAGTVAMAHAGGGADAPHRDVGAELGEQPRCGIALALAVDRAGRRLRGRDVGGAGERVGAGEKAGHGMLLDENSSLFVP